MNTNKCKVITMLVFELTTPLEGVGKRRNSRLLVESRGGAEWR